MRRKMYATAMTAMLVTGTLMGLAVPAAERDGVTLHGDSTYDSIEKITDEDLTLKIMLAILFYAMNISQIYGEYK